MTYAQREKGTYVKCSRVIEGLKELIQLKGSISLTERSWTLWERRGGMHHTTILSIQSSVSPRGLKRASSTMLT
jgi:hypothetical protein